MRLLIAVAAAMVATTGIAHAQTPVTGLPAPTPIAAYSGRLVWSAPDAKGGYQLMQRIGDGPVQALPVTARKVPFDVDLGPTSGGTVYAVYSRCKTEPDWNGQQMPAYETGKGCDVYKLDLGSMTETRYSKVNASDGSEYWPSYWKGQVAFVRAYDDDPGKPYIYVKTISSSSPSQRQPGGSRGSRSSTALQVELYGSRLGFAWRYQADRDAPAYDLRVDTTGGDHIRLDSTPGGGLSSTVLGWPSFENGRIYWLRSCVGDPGGCQSTRRFQQSQYTGSPTPLVASSPAYTAAMERDQSITWTETDVSSGYICMTDPATTPQCEIQPLRPDYAPLN
ncbi:MAG TPA: hypothetical protein VKB54_16885 [Solirubrobacteraceae bacterium]|nr:hypothetical protein [Solirubrobacteraceae bacterium]